MNTVVCVLRSGGDYSPYHVEKLRKQIKVFCKDVRFICISDVPLSCEHILLNSDWSGWYAKMEMCRPDIEGDFLYLDLDMVVVGSLDDIFSVRHSTVLRDFYWNRYANKNYDSVCSALMYLKAEDRAKVWQYWSEAPRDRQIEAGRAGDQYIFEKILGAQADRWQDVLPGQVVSYKADMRDKALDKPPQNARIVCFHGKPRPWKAQDAWVHEIYASPLRLWAEKLVRRNFSRP